MLVEAPASDDSTLRETLAYVEAYDAVLNGDYAFVAFKEVDRSSGEGCVRIRALHLTGVVFQPTALRGPARSACAQGKRWFTWGNGITPSAGDPRQIEYRVHVANDAPSAIEILVQTRRFDHSVAEAKSVIFPWPSF